MPDLLVELLSEEIPARMQARAAEDLKSMFTKSLEVKGLTYDVAEVFCTPRRLALHVTELPLQTPDLQEERKGPRLDAPVQAKDGFLRASGLNSLDDAKIVSDPQKGDYYVAIFNKAGRSAEEVISECLSEVVRKLPWPKSMKWGSGKLRWVRPLHSILCTLGGATDKIKSFQQEIEGIPIGNVTRGHRFMDESAITAQNFEDYVSKLEEANVVLDSERRQDIILHDTREQADALGLELCDDDNLLRETAGLVEWPVVLVGQFDKSFLSIPDEVIRTSIREHQKCFVMRDPKTKKLSNRFALVANIEASDGGKAIIAGNQRVVAARLSDAKFFWDSDLNTPMEEMNESLKEIIFHEKLGTVADRVDRIRALSSELSPMIGADPKLAERAAFLCKADLVSKMVNEFPELQGTMGRYYASFNKELEEVADAIENHYKPVGQSDTVPTDPVSVAVALADKLDMLTGFWMISEKPTGSKDPFALRRAALGVVSLILHNNVRIPLRPILIRNLKLLNALPVTEPKLEQIDSDNLPSENPNQEPHVQMRRQDLIDDLLEFFADRLKVVLREKGVRHDLIDAVFALENQDDIALAVKRVEALQTLIDSQDGTNLLAGYKRAANILRAEEKKDGKIFDGEYEDKLLELDAEKELAKLLKKVRTETNAALERENFAGAVESLATLRPVVDEFFDKILVNDQNPQIRENRLKILNEFRKATLEIADFSKIAG